MNIPTRANGIPVERFSILNLSAVVETWSTPPIYTAGIKALQIFVNMAEKIDVTGAERPVAMQMLCFDENAEDISNAYTGRPLIPVIYVRHQNAINTNGITMVTIGPGLQDAVWSDDVLAGWNMDQYRFGLYVPPVWRLQFIHFPGDAKTYSVWCNLIR